jgi:uncharacterized protein YfaS (alpha-2-macroglobulin family)
MRARRGLVFCFVSSLVIFLLWFARPCEAQSMSAIWSRGNLSCTLPYHAPRPGAGTLTLELLSPEDTVLSSAERTVEVTGEQDTWKEALTVPHSLPYDELVWERVRWRFRYDGETTPMLEQIRSVSTILRRPVMHILGQTSYVSGAQAAVRMVVTDATGAGEPATATHGTVRIELLAPGARPRNLYTGSLDLRGTAEAEFQFPAGLKGEVGLRFVAETALGRVETTQQVKLEDKISILLTTEKPIYQPAQTVHIRALALDLANDQAAAGRKLTFEVEDSRGNKVFRKATETDRFGVASAEFGLADEVNLGAYHLRALMGDSESPSPTAEITLNVERYVLPKFRVAVDFPLNNGKPKRDYRPGEHVTGTVHANYFFGKPVDRAEITVKVTGADVAEFVAAHEEGETDAAGDYHFDLRLPDFLAGTGLAQGSAPVAVEASVKDGAGHTEAHEEDIIVSGSPLLVMAVPEGGKLVPGIANQTYLLASYPDGTPAQATMTVHGQGLPAIKTTTDASGVAVIQIKASGETEKLAVRAEDQRGNHVSRTLEVETRNGDDQILLRTGQVVFKAGDRMELTILSTRRTGGAYIDLVRNGQTILTRDVDLEDGHAMLSVPVTPEMAGTLAVDAYVFGSNSEAIADRRLVFVEPPDDLHIEATADAASYLPGSEARVHFRVTNAKGEGVVAALGLEVVDEAVLALAEKQPGFAKVFFFLERELMKPRYEIHSLTPESIVEPGEGDSEARNRDASALLAAAETVDPHTMNAEAGRELPQEQAQDFTARYLEAFTDSVRGIAEELSRAATDHKDEDIPSLFATLIDGHRPGDAWGTELRLDPGWGGGRNTVYRVRSAGPDGQFDTEDDMTVMLSARAGQVFTPGRGGTITVRLEHDHGPVNGRAEITGIVTDLTGAVVPGAFIVLRGSDDKSERRAVSDREGSFSLAALPPGKYDIRITAPGFMTSTRRLELAAQDRAVLATALQVGSVTTTVAVMAAAPTLATEASVFEMRAAPAPMVAGAFVQKDALNEVPRAKAVEANAQQQAQQEPHVRSWFPEALYINPEIVTDANGKATIGIPLADSITTWRMAMFASTASGALGTGASSLKVFQDFFVDLDLPVTLTQGDRVSVPVAVYNYSGQKGDVALALEPADWFTLASDTAEKSVSVDAGAVGGSQFTIEAQHVGKFKLTLTARLSGGSERRDVVVREIEVVPDGREQNIVFNGRLDSRVSHTIQFPETSIPEAKRIFVRLYPGPLSQVIEGMDGILQMPDGCFEQTSSSTYPNVLALDYMRRNNKLTPEVRAKAESYIATGYQRLLTFEVAGGGFSWFGQAPANKILTAYGLMEFHDMSRVYDVDPRLLARTAAWLAGQQQPDGSWRPDTQFINEGATNRYNSDVLRITAYIAWALETAGGQNDAVAKAKSYITDRLNEKADAYTLAVLANFAAEDDEESELTHRVMQMLLDAHEAKGDVAWWSSEETGVYGSGESAAVETTGLAVQALLKSGQSPEVTHKALAWILSKKTAYGNWGTTQATIMALRALLLASDRIAGEAKGNVEVVQNGKTVQTLALNQENDDLLQQFVLPVPEGVATNDIELRFNGSGGMAYQVAGRYFVPWKLESKREPLTIDLVWDRTHLAENEIATETAAIRNNLRGTANMVMVDLGIPPGFDLLSEDLQDVLEKTTAAKSGRLEKFSLTATQAILYFDSIGAGQTVKLSVRLRAKYPIRAKNFESRVYEYYDPAVSATAAPTQFEVTR